MKRTTFALMLLVGGLASLALTARLPSTAGAHDGPRLAVAAASSPRTDEGLSCERPLLDFRVVAHDANGRPVVDAMGRPVWEPALAVGSDGEPRHRTSAYIRSSAFVSTDGAGRPQVVFEFTDEGFGLFDELTRRIIGQPLGIFVDDEPLSSPIVAAAISMSGVITGVTEEAAHDLAARINAEATLCPTDG